MNNDMFEVKEEQKKSGFLKIMLIVLGLMFIAGVVTVVGLGMIHNITNSTELSDERNDTSVLIEEDAIVLNDIPAKGCMTLFCGSYKELGYEVSYYVSGPDFKPGMYTMTIEFDETPTDNQYMIVETADPEDRNFPYNDARFLAMDFFGGVPENGDITISNMPLIKTTDLEVLYKNGFNDQITLIPQNGYTSAKTDGAVNNQGFYPVGKSIEPGDYEISSLSDGTTSPYYILNSSNSEIGSFEDSTFTLEKGDTLVLEHNTKLTKI